MGKKTVFALNSAEDFQMAGDHGVSWFKNVNQYAQEKGIQDPKIAGLLITQEDAGDDPDKVPVILVRTALLNKENVSQKYVMTQVFFNYGDLCVIDIFSFPREFHREMLDDQFRSVLMPELSGQSIGFNINDPSKINRYVVAGGHMKIAENHCEVSGQSGDFGGNMGFDNINPLVGYLLTQTGWFDTVDAEKRDLSIGENYIDSCLDLMASHKLSEDFHYRMVDVFTSGILRGANPTSYLYEALFYMRCIDRCMRHDRDVFSVMAEELSDGISRYMLVKSVSLNIQIPTEE